MGSLDVGHFVYLISVMTYCKTMGLEESLHKENPTFTGENCRKKEKSYVPVTCNKVSVFADVI